ncbi:MAG: hypothetical protein HY812_17175 [Planctomycetes bacterium]|nr:hypothetical protein [Planctomycetota bacterium]
MNLALLVLILASGVLVAAPAPATALLALYLPLNRWTARVGILVNLLAIAILVPGMRSFESGWQILIPLLFLSPVLLNCIALRWILENATGRPPEGGAPPV